MISRKLKTGWEVISSRGPLALGRRAGVLACEKLAGLSRSFSANMNMYAHLIAGSANRAALRRNYPFDNAHQGKRAFVIGTGPSLAKHDLSCLKDEITFGVNSFWKHSINKEWNAKYFCFVDQQYFSNDPVWRNELSQLCTATRNSTFFIPTYGREAMRECGIPEERTFFMGFAGLVNEGIIFKPRLSKPLPLTWNVVQTGLLIALAMGCNPIYLIGCDHNWGADQEEWGHFHAGSATLENLPPFNSNCQMYREAYYVFEAYQHIAKLCKSMGVQVYNASYGGRLDVFERVYYPNLFAH